MYRFSSDRIFQESRKHTLDKSNDGFHLLLRQTILIKDLRLGPLVYRRRTSVMSRIYTSEIPTLMCWYLLYALFLSLSRSTLTLVYLSCAVISSRKWRDQSISYSFPVNVYTGPFKQLHRALIFTLLPLQPGTPEIPRGPTAPGCPGKPFWPSMGNKPSSPYWLNARIRSQRDRMHEEYSLVLLCCHIDRGHLFRRTGLSFRLVPTDLSYHDHPVYPENLVDLRHGNKEERSQSIAVT